MTKHEAIRRLRAMIATSHESEAVSMAITALEAYEPWRPASDLPEHACHVLMCIDGFGILIQGRCEGGRFYAGSDGIPVDEHGMTVRTWKPLPEIDK